MKSLERMERAEMVRSRLVWFRNHSRLPCIPLGCYYRYVEVRSEVRSGKCEVRRVHPEVVGLELIGDR